MKSAIRHILECLDIVYNLGFSQHFISLPNDILISHGKYVRNANVIITSSIDLVEILSNVLKCIKMQCYEEQ